MDVLSCHYFQTYSNIKWRIHCNSEDLLVTQEIATAALTLPESAAEGFARVRAIQQRPHWRVQGVNTPDDLEKSRPYARDRQRIHHAVAESDLPSAWSRSSALMVRLTPSWRNLRTILDRPSNRCGSICKRHRTTAHLLRCFRPTVFPQISGSFAWMFELLLGEMLRRFRAQGPQVLAMALSQGAAALVAWVTNAPQGR